MNILLISASPRREKSQTLLLAREVLKGASDEKTTSEIVHLCDLKIEFCRHCELCHKKILACPIDDDVSVLLGKMLEADGIILATPNYINQVTASMKALLDRSSHFIHCMRLSDKYVAGVVSSGSGNDAGVLDYIRHYANICGAQYSGGVSSRAAEAEEKMSDARALGEKFALDIREERIHPDQSKTIEQAKYHFAKVMEMRKEEWIEEYQYWKDRNWL